MDPELAAADGAALLRLARAALEAAVVGGAPQRSATGAAGEMRRGAFVTLRKAGVLRGCVGDVSGGRPLGDVVLAAAAAAALEDPRFPPLTAVELSEVAVEISVLAPPQRMSPVDPAAVAVGRHGVMVRLGATVGVLLPQVAVEHRLDATAFLAAACRKAGLPDGAWRRPDAEVLVFEAETVAE